VGEVNNYLATRWAELLDRPARGDHIVQLYDDEAFLAQSAAHFVAEGLRRGESAALIGTQPRWQALTQRLQMGNIDVDSAVRRSQLAFFDATFVVERCMNGASVERERFTETLDIILSLMARDYPSVRVFNELADLLWAQKKPDAALALEALLGELETAQPVSFLCACRLDCLDSAAYDGTLQRVCQAHTHLMPGRNTSWLDDTVMRAANEILEPQLAYMLRALAETHRPPTAMPASQATLFWLKENMPRTAERVLSRVREHIAGR
jgi:MEDS: MEthanogen/methylotroph, DcmR Sensory domain